MDTTAKKLREAMENVKPDDLDGHKHIWSFSVKHMDPASVPDIYALAYGASRMLLPEMHWDSTPALLDIFALAETIRQQTVQDAKEALVWDQFYRKGGPDHGDGQPLSDQERKALKSITKKTNDETMRETYMTVVMQVCWAHIHLLRQSSETFRIPHFFYQYFPATNKLREPGGLEYSWLRDLSDSELIAYGATRRKLMEFLEDAEEWEEEYFKSLAISGSDSKAVRNTAEYQARFCERFPLIVQWETLAGIITRHLAKVQNMFSKLHSTMPDSDSTPDMDRESDLGMPPIPGLGRGQREDGSSPVRQELQGQDFNLKIVDRKHARAVEQSSDEESKKESQESNASSKLSYVDAPANVIRAPPTSLL